MRTQTGLISKVLLSGALTTVTLACSKNNSSGTATAILKFSNLNNSPMALIEQVKAWMLGFPAYAATASAVTTFKMKLIAAYLTADIDPVTQNNVGMTSMFYLNPDCQEDISHCDISSGTAEDGQPMSQVVTHYFDFAQSSADVNAALNSQGRSIYAATYKYVRLEFCKYNSGNSDNIIWAGSSSGGDINFRRNSCTVNSAQISPAITVADGDSVTVTVAYNYNNAISTGSDAMGDDCTGSGASKTCFTLPQFTPSASK